MNDQPAILSVDTSMPRLAALCAEYSQLKPQVDALTERLKTITDGIKAEAMDRAHGCTVIDVNAPCLALPLRLQARTAWHFDVKRFKVDDPHTYVRYAEQRTTWALRQVTP